MKFLPLCFFALTISSLVQAEVISRAVARFGSEVITSRQVIMSQVIDSYLRNETKVNILRPDEEGFSEKTTELVLDYIVFLESESFAVGDEEVKSLQPKIPVLMKSLSASKELEKFRFTQAEVEKLLRIKTKARRFLEIKSQSQPSQISDQKAKEYFDQHRAKFSGASFVDIRDNIKIYLQKIENEAKLKDWFEVLKRKFKLKYLNQEAISVHFYQPR
jgi:hypothetical protein